jgi:hypothetical protein
MLHQIASDAPALSLLTIVIEQVGQIVSVPRVHNVCRAQFLGRIKAHI